MGWDGNGLSQGTGIAETILPKDKGIDQMNLISGKKVCLRGTCP